MAKLIIYVGGTPNIHGHKRREFLWNPEMKLYLYEGKEIEDTEFNAKFELAMKRNYDMNPRVRVTSAGGEPRVIERVVVKDAAPIPAPPTMTVDDAVEVLARLAPEKLVAPPRKRGRPPSAPKVAELA